MWGDDKKGENGCYIYAKGLFGIVIVNRIVFIGWFSPVIF